MKTANSKPDVERWLDGEISAGRLIHNSSLETCYPQASDLVGGIWQALHAKAYALDAELDKRIAVAKQFAEEAKHDNTRTVIHDVTAEAIRVRALQETRSLLRFHLLGCIDNTGAAGAP